jgi:hypothetical protein
VRLAEQVIIYHLVEVYHVIIQNRKFLNEMTCFLSLMINL